MTRGRDDNHAYLYHRVQPEADHEHARPDRGRRIHRVRRGNKLLGRALPPRSPGQRRPSPHHAHRSRAHRPRVAARGVTEVIQRHQERRRTRQTAWGAHMKTAQAWRAGHKRMAAAATTRTAGIDLDAGGLEQ